MEKTIGSIVVFALVFSALLMFDGFILSKVYNMAVVPVYSFQPIGIAQAIGLSCVVAFFKLDVGKMLNEMESDNGVSGLGKVILHIVLALFLWLVTYIVTRLY
jgi:hypothetical protein